MASSKEYLEYVLELFNEPSINYKYMFGEYTLYFKDKIIGGIFDNQLLLKPTKSVLNHIKEPTLVLPYDGAKTKMVLSDKDDSELLKTIVLAMYDQILRKSLKKLDTKINF